MSLVVGAFTASAISDRISRKTVMQIGVIIATFLTLLVALAQSGTQLIIIRVLTGFGAGFAVTASFPIAVELMPKQHRRTFGAIYEVMLASAFTLLPFLGYLLAGNPDGFRLIALPGGLALGIVPLLVHFGLPESARWYLRRGKPEAAVETVNRMIERCGNRVPPLTIHDLGPDLDASREALPPFKALFHTGQLRRTVVGTLCWGHRIHRLLLFGGPAAKGAGGPGRRRHFELRAEYVAVHGDDSGQVLHRLHYGDHRPPLDPHLLPRRGSPRSCADGSGASHGCARDGGDDRGSDHHRPHRAVLLHRGAGLSFRAVSHRTAGPWALFRRGDRAALFWRANAVPIGTAHRFPDDLLRHDHGRGGGGRLRASASRQGNGRPARTGHRGERGARLLSRIMHRADRSSGSFVAFG